MKFSVLWHQVWSLAFLIGVIGNLVANLCWALPALKKLHRKLDRHHAELIGSENQDSKGAGHEPESSQDHE